MKRILTILVAITSLNVFGGNPDRIGENGATQLLINGWPRSTGVWDMYTSRVMGVEAMGLNVAGLAHVKKMEAVFSQSLWLQGSNTQVSQAGFAGKVGADNVIGLSIFSLNVGDLARTTVNNPEGAGLGTFKPTFINVGLSFARAFSNRIYGGATIRLINESIENVRASGFALDAGLQYLLGEKENVRFGVSVRNLGTPMKYQGDGFTFRGMAPDGDDYELTLSQNSNKFELPAMLTIGASYDLWMGPEYRCNGAYNLYRLTMGASFNSNSYGKDHFGGGIEFAFRELFMVRGGYRHEQGIMNPDLRTSAFTGFSGGMSVQVPFSPNGPSLGIDYSYRTSNPFGGTHSIGVRFALGDGTDCGESDADGKDAFGEEKSKKGKEVKLSKSEEKQLSDIASAIQFETGSADLSDEVKAELDKLVSLLEKKDKATLSIEAHTDNVGADADNLKLSEDRANAVKDYLTGNGISAKRIDTVAYGERKPIADNSTEEGKAKNRRVELIVK
jgi:outer membrane protein OmpA-like peptidoglycan-associated protein